MRIAGIRCYAWTIAWTIAAVGLFGCAASQPPVGAPAAMPQPLVPASHVDARRSALLYVSEPAVNHVSIYAYPSLTYEGELPRLGPVFGVCSDPRSGDVWIVSWRRRSGGYSLLEFRHGGTKPVRTLSTAQPNLYGCSVNPSNGDLAVAQVSDYDDPGRLLVFAKRSGKPAYYYGSIFAYYFVGYDAAGDAFVDGYDEGGDVRLDELRAGTTKLTDITPRGLVVRTAGGVQYDGTNVAVGSQHGGVVYRISGNRVVGKTKLLRTCSVGEFAIDANAIIVPSACGDRGRVLIYDYPAGGAPVAELKLSHAPFAAAVSR